MNTSPLGSALDDLVRDVRPSAGPPVDSLWAQGSRRRARTRLGGVAAAALALALVAFVGWPSLSRPAPPSVPQPARTVAPDTYPSVLAHPYFAPDALTAHRAMTVAVLDGATAYTLDSKGNAWEVPGSGDQRAYAALSPNGRWLVDGRRVYDLVAGSSATVAQPGATDDIQLWAAWAPDSAHYARAYEPSNSIVVSTPDGQPVSVPGLTAYEQAIRGRMVTGRWLDDRTLMVASASLTDTALEIHTWTIGDTSWRAPGLLTYPDELDLGDSPAAAVSPDGRTLAIGASDMAGTHDSALVTWDVGALVRSGRPTPASVRLLGSRYGVDGITWRGGTPLVTVSDHTGPVGGSPLVETTAGFAGQTSWRSNAFDGAPYWNSAAVWRARLVVWTTIPLALFGVWLLWRAALWVARRLGIIDGPLPLRFDLAWWRR